MRDILSRANRMSESEAMKELHFLYGKLYNGIFSNRLWCINVAIDALQDIQKYRAIGTVEECRKAMEKCREN